MKKSDETAKNQLTEDNAKFAVVRTAFHGGRAIAFTNDIDEAYEIRKQNRSRDCTCGCCNVVPITTEAAKELVQRWKKEDRYVLVENVDLYDELPFYDPSLGYGRLCR